MQVTENVGRSTIVLEDDALRVVIDATLGGKIRSFYSKDNEMEYFYTDKRSCFPGSGYSNHDISGLDECFPTIGSCSFPCGEYSGTLIDDHGHLWNMPWELRSHEDTVAMGCDLPEFSVRFDRDCRLEKTGILRFDYRIRNYGKQPLPYLYAAHPMLALHELPSRTTQWGMRARYSAVRGWSAQEAGGHRKSCPARGFWKCRSRAWGLC